MSMPLPPINSAPWAPPAAQLPLSKPPGVSANEQNSFKTLLVQFNEEQANADAAVKNLVTGKTDDVQQVVTQVVKSEMSFRLFMEVRNQLIESYNEIMRMQF